VHLNRPYVGEVKLSSRSKIYRMIVCECIYRSARQTASLRHG